MPQQSQAAACESAQPGAAAVSQRLCDLLLSFPAAAIGGVQWQVLARKYEERYAVCLDLASLRHSSPLAAATALLWDVLRVVDREDTDNPVVGLEDAVALTPQPGLLGCWPSLYQALCHIVLEHGLPEPLVVAGDTTPASNLLLSQLRPLLERHWHANFDESALGFRSEEGTFVRLKKLKHLLHAVLKWRNQRQAWRQAHDAKFTAVDEALVPRLELVAAEKHNDLMLRCSSTQEVSTPHSVGTAQCRLAAAPSTRGSPCKLQVEVERLRAENKELRARNQLLQESSKSTTSTPQKPGRQSAPCELPADIFDDPFEPPPERHAWSVSSRTVSTHFSGSDAGSEVNCSASWATSGTPMISSWQSACTSANASGAVTPVQRSPFAQQNCAYVPMWFPFLQAASDCFVDVSVIPRGIVQSAREQFERLGGQ